MFLYNTSVFVCFLWKFITWCSNSNINHNSKACIFVEMFLAFLKLTTSWHSLVRRKWRKPEGSQWINYVIPWLLIQHQRSLTSVVLKVICRQPWIAMNTSPDLTFYVASHLVCPARCSEMNTSKTQQTSIHPLSKLCILWGSCGGWGQSQLHTNHWNPINQWSVWGLYVCSRLAAEKCKRCAWCK